jgi:hypothetical protein
MRLIVKFSSCSVAAVLLALGLAAGSAAAQTTTNPFGGTAQTGTPAQAAPAPAPKKAKAPAALGSGQFASEAEAKASCPGDTVVWANLSSKVYHYSTAKTYGKTKHGAYICEKGTAVAGFRAAKKEQRP